MGRNFKRDYFESGEIGWAARVDTLFAESIFSHYCHGRSNCETLAQHRDRRICESRRRRGRWKIELPFEFDFVSLCERDTKGVSYLDSSSPQGASSRFNFQKDRRAKTTDDLSTLGYSVQLKRLLRLFPLRGVNWSDLALNRVSRENCLGPISRAISSARQRVNQTKVYLNLNSRESVNFRVLTRGKTRDSFEINRVQLVVESSLVSLTA